MAVTSPVRGSDLAVLRQAIGLTQTQLAARLGVSRSAVCNAEAREKPSRRWLARYLKVVGGE
jgi:transcriptional regulator with XRE-family HTH domain